MVSLKRYTIFITSHSDTTVIKETPAQDHSLRTRETA